MNIKEQENQVSVNLYLRMAVNIIAYLVLAGLAGYRLYRVSRSNNTGPVTGVAVPKLKVDNFSELSGSPKATSSGTRNLQIIRGEPFD